MTNRRTLISLASFATVAMLILLMLAMELLLVSPRWWDLMIFLEQKAWPWLFLVGLPIAMLGFGWLVRNGHKWRGIIGFGIIFLFLSWFVFGGSLVYKLKGNQGIRAERQSSFIEESLNN